ncbi:MAG: Verru_Chthon cassette protein C [Verrucomicrobiaceae bacterium]|nr:MAG: Verru_Chthon cassette protein C [Verrucomicrobiaceae bacterium]
MIRTHRGFTLVELMASTAVLSVLLLILVSVSSQTSNTWKFTRSKVEQFRSARNAFESMTRQISQATLNTYWDYEMKGSGALATPSKYIRQSDLRFITGSAQELTGSATPVRPGHGIFFQAPLGFSDSQDFRGLGNLINTWGYFVEFNSDRQFRPRFLDNVDPPLTERYRYRLMEVMQPANKFTLYSKTSNLNYAGRDWIQQALPTTESPTPRQVHVLGENIITLVLLPKLPRSEDPTGIRLAPGYTYDSTVTGSDPETNPKNQLPPLVQVTVVALDEPSAARIAQDDVVPDLGLKELFKANGPGSAARFEEDLDFLKKGLSERRLSFRVFTTNVSIRGAKWSRD